MHAEQEPPGVIVLYNASERLVKGEPHDLLAEQGVIACAHAVAEALARAGHRVTQVPLYGNVELALAPYPPTEWVIFNLGEGLEGRLFEEARIAWALEAMGYRFTGTDGEAIANSTHKARAKVLLTAAGVPTPPWRTFHHPTEVTPDQMVGLTFPLIVKPVAEDASLGIGPKAVVHTVNELRERVDYVVEHYRQSALAEEFVAGRELNVSLWGDPPEVLPLAEVDFGDFANPYERIVSFAAKWQEDSFAYRHTPVICPARVDPAVATNIAATARRAWRAIGCRSYARVDLRLASDGTPYVVEVNCNPDLSPDAGFFRAARAAGWDYAGMAVHILQLALRHKYTYDRESRRARQFTSPRVNGRHRGLQAGGSSLRGRAVEGLS